MNLLIDNNAGLGQQDYTSYVDADHLPQVVRRLNCAATLTASLVASDDNFDPPRERRPRHPATQRRIRPLHRISRHRS